MENYIVVEECDDYYGAYDELRDKTIYHSLKKIEEKYFPKVIKSTCSLFYVYEITKNELVEKGKVSYDFLTKQPTFETEMENG